MIMVDGQASRCFLAIVHGFQRRSYNSKVLWIGATIIARSERSEAVNGVEVGEGRAREERQGGDCRCWSHGSV